MILKNVPFENNSICIFSYKDLPQKVRLKYQGARGFLKKMDIFHNVAHKRTQRGFFFAMVFIFSIKESNAT